MRLLLLSICLSITFCSCGTTKKYFKECKHIGDIVWECEDEIE